MKFVKGLNPTRTWRSLIQLHINAPVKVFLGPEELKDGAHKLNFADNGNFSHLCFISNSDGVGVEGSQILQVENESFNVISISKISKFILRKSTLVKPKDDIVCI